MTERVNKTYPFNKDGVKVFGKLDELMLKYYRVPNGTPEGALSLEAFEVGQRLQFYFTVYSSVVINETMEGQKMKFPEGEQGIAFCGLEAPFYLLVNNTFYQNNFQVITSNILNQLTRMNTARSLPKEDIDLTYGLQLSSNEYLSVIAGLVGGTKAQREMDLELKAHNKQTMTQAVESLRKIGKSM